jgi:hypothetical protein
MVHDPELAELNRQMRGRIEELEKKYPVGDALRIKQPPQPKAASKNCNEIERERG